MPSDPALIHDQAQVLMASGAFVAPLSASYTAPSAAALLGTAITWQGVRYDPVHGLQRSKDAS